MQRERRLRQAPFLFHPAILSDVMHPSPFSARRHVAASPTLADPHADRRKSCWLIGTATLLRLVVAALLPLGVDESYAAVVSRTLSLSYFDHPPAAFWMAHIAAQLGGESPLALRWPFVLLFALSSWLLFALTSRLFSARAGFWTVAAAQVIPVFSLSAGSWVLPDGPLLCASVAAALALAHAIPLADDDRHGDSATSSASRGDASRRWLAVGAALGAAGLSKYHAALLGAGMLLFVFTDPYARRWLRRREPYVAVLLAMLCVLPVFAWNAAHDWVSFRFQGGRAAGQGHAITALLQNLAGQAGYLLPWFWVPLVVLLMRGLRGGPRQRAVWFCCCLGVGPVIVFTIASLGGRPGLPHWPAPGYFLLLPLLGAAIARWEARAPRVARRLMMAATAVFVALVTIVTSHAATGWVATLVPSLHRKDPAFELLAYRSLRDSLATRGLLQRAGHVATTDWIRGAKIGYALGPQVPMVVLNTDGRHFPYLRHVGSLNRSSGLLLVAIRREMSDADAAIVPETYRVIFDSVHHVGRIPVLRGADTALLVSVFTTHGLRAAALPLAR